VIPAIPSKPFGARFAHSGLRWIALLTLLASLTACFDHRRAVAFATLVDPNGRFQTDAYLAALRARFPAGSSLVALTQYVAAARGECHEGEVDTLRCEIPLRGVVCGAELAAVTVTHKAGKLLDLAAVVGGIGC